MHREYVKWYSERLQRDMEILLYGHAGLPMMVFPTSMGRFYEYEDRGMVHALSGAIDQGHLQVFCVDSVDKESWYNKRAHPGYRAHRHNQYDSYLVHEAVPFVRSRNQSPRFASSGCSFGGYHATNFALRHPDVVTDCVSMSGAYDIHQFVRGHYDENCYFNCPVDYLPGLSDEWFLERYRRMTLLLAVGEHDICLGENYRLAQILGDRHIPHKLDVWGFGARHDWPLWHDMARRYFQ